MKLFELIKSLIDKLLKKSNEKSISDKKIIYDERTERWKNYDAWFKEKNS